MHVISFAIEIQVDIITGICLFDANFVSDIDNSAIWVLIINLNFIILPEKVHDAAC